MTRSLLGSDQRLRRRLYPAIVALGIAALMSDAAAAPAATARAVEAPHRLAGTAYVHGDTVGSSAPSGFGPSDNASVVAPHALLAAAEGLHLVVEPDAHPRWGEHDGIQVYIVNSSGETVTLSAMDSRIELVQEALTPAGAWVAIEHLPQSWCGNSYHQVALGAGRMWSLVLPRYTGSLPTSLRLRLDRPEGALYSAPFSGAITPGQLSEETDHHAPSNLMDPYDW